MSTRWTEKARFWYKYQCRRPYRFAKFYQKQQQRKSHQKEHEEYLLKLRQEAFADLQLQLQNYNDEFINRMRYMENNRDESHLSASPSTNSISSASSGSSSDNDEVMHDLVGLFEAGTVKDYTPLIEWESCKVKYKKKKKWTNANSNYITNRIQLLLSKTKVNTVTFGDNFYDIPLVFRIHLEVNQVKQRTCIYTRHDSFLHKQVILTIKHLSIKWMGGNMLYKLFYWFCLAWFGWQ